MIDANAVVSAALKAESVPEQALRLAQARCTVYLSTDVRGEIGRVLMRPRLASRVSSGRVASVLALLDDGARWIEPTIRVTDCRDAKDDRYLELALAASADIIVSGDMDLLILDPWRGVRVMTPAQFVRLWPPLAA